MCNKPPWRQPLQCPPVVTNVVKQPGEYWQRSQIGCNSPEHSGPLWDKSQTLGSALAPLRRRQQPHRTVAVGPSVGCYWKPLAFQLFGSPVYCRWAPWGVFVYCRRLDEAHKGDLLRVKEMLIIATLLSGCRCPLVAASQRGQLEAPGWPRFKHHRQVQKHSRNSFL